jgi:hypothetical protein
MYMTTEKKSTISVKKMRATEMGATLARMARSKMYVPEWLRASLKIRRRRHSRKMTKLFSFPNTRSV